MLIRNNADIDQAKEQIDMFKEYGPRGVIDVPLKSIAIYHDIKMC